MSNNLINKVFFDLETQRSSDDVGGWGHIADMGLSVAVTYSSTEGRYHVYTEHNVQSLIRALQGAGLVVGFNVLRFDYVVLSAYTNLPLHKLPTMDMLDYIYRHLGFRISLDDLARVNLGISKSGHGLQAITWWNQGDIAAIIDYCRRDVEITKTLYELGRALGFLRYQRRAGLDNKVKVKW